MKKRPIIWLVYPAYLAIAVVSAVAVAWYASSMFKKLHYSRTGRELESAARLVAERVRERADDLASPGTDELCDTLGRASGYRITVILPDGKVVGDSDEGDLLSMDNHKERPEIAHALKTGSPGIKDRYSNTLGKNMLYVAVPLKNGDDTIAVVRTSLSLSLIDDALTRMWRRMAIAVLILAGVVAVAAMRIARGIRAPLEQIRAGAESFGKGNLEGRLASSDVLEIDVLANTMNKMADQLNDRIQVVTRQRDEQKALLSCMIEAVLAIDNNKSIIRMNDAAEKMFGLTSSECLGKNVAEVIRNADLLNVVDRALSSSEPVEGDIMFGDDSRYLQGHGTVLHGSGGERIGALIVLHDVTRLRKLEMMRRDFVANVSHELKTPITSIKGFVDTLVDTPVESREDVDRFLNIIRKQANRLQAIVEDLLALSQLEHGTENREIPLERGNIRDVLLNAVQEYSRAAEKKDIKLRLSCEKGVIAELNDHLLGQAVSNLIDNAIKYSEAGTAVEVNADLQGDHVVIRVSDQGPGIARKHLPRLFERFYRVDKARSRNLGGTGLGLALVKHIAIAHNGSVKVDSQLGKGSTFSILLPQTM